MISKLYYECHVTIDPVDGDQLEKLRSITEFYQFRVAKFIMVKDPVQDSFCTGRSKDLVDLTIRMRKLVEDLKLHGYVVRRYKIEDTVLDSKVYDVMGLVAA